MSPFYTVTDSLGKHAYFKSPEAAAAYAATILGSYVLMTTPNKIWRVTAPACQPGVLISLRDCAI